MDIVCEGETDEGYDLGSDTAHCGGCGRTCVLPNVVEVGCEEGRCTVVTCAEGTTDLDRSPLNGCEAWCVPSNEGVEICDGEDNDCDGATDDGFFFALDPSNCGACGVVCEGPHAEIVCVEGECVVASCEPSWSDADGVAENGCEAVCEAGPNAAEVCDGADNDCDGVADEGFRDADGVYNLQMEHCGACDRRCAIPHAEAECTRHGVCLFVACQAGWIDANSDVDRDGCEEPCVPTGASADGCNGLDDDCDGETDEDALVSEARCYPHAEGCLASGAGGWVCAGACAVGVMSCAGGVERCTGAVGPRPETCDGADDDCDGELDEVFDLMSSLLHCGACGQSCIETRPANATAHACRDGSCRWSCDPGHLDLDGDLEQGSAGTGCEVECTPTAPDGVEICDGHDNDCDGEVDEADGMVPPPQGLCRTDAGTPCAGTVARCRAGLGGVRYRCLYPPEVETDPVDPNRVLDAELRCDGHDGDCDGLPDDGFEPAVGEPCDSGPPGRCRDRGAFACSPDGSKTVCVITEPGSGPSVEVCDGEDNDCDGAVDEPEHQNPEGSFVVDAVVRVDGAGQSFAIYAFEASRPDASAAAAGEMDHRPCSRALALPWSGARYGEAVAACAAAGMRLCTPAEWAAACQGASGRGYPYGDVFQATTCNGADAGAGAVIPGGSYAGCGAQHTGGSVYDLSGNVKEWVDDGATNGFHQVRGGAYLTPEAGLTCDFELSVVREDASIPGVGFRCCGD